MPVIVRNPKLDEGTGAQRRYDRAANAVVEHDGPTRIRCERVGREGRPRAMVRRVLPRTLRIPLIHCEERPRRLTGCGALVNW